MSARLPRVVMLIKDADAFRGSAVQMRHLSLALIERGVDLQLLCQYRRQPPAAAPRLEARTVRVRGERSREFYREAEKWLDENASAYDLIHVHGHGSLSMMAARVARRYQKAVLVKITSAGPGTRLHSWEKWLKIAPFLRARLIVGNEQWASISSETTRGLRALGVPSEKIWAIPNGVDALFRAAPPSERAALRAAFKVGESEKIVVSIGNLKPHKRVDAIISAFETAAGDMENSQLWIIGDGEQRAELEAQAARSGCGGRIAFLGRMEREAVAERLRAADIFVLTSRNEGLSNALLEAMGCGLATISVRISGNEDVVRDGENGILLDWDEAAAPALQKLLQTPDLSALMGKTAAEDIERDYSLDSVAGRYAATYRQISPAIEL